jgi:hypothetical protein
METQVRTPQMVFMQPQRFVVPLFQRPYVWNEENQWEPLWGKITRCSFSIGSSSMNTTYINTHPWHVSPFPPLEGSLEGWSSNTIGDFDLKRSQFRGPGLEKVRVLEPEQGLSSTNQSALRGRKSPRRFGRDGQQ